MKTIYVLRTILIFTSFLGVLCEEYQTDGGFLQSPTKYFEATESNSTTPVPAMERKHEPRFGFPISYGNDLQGYNTGATFAPVKIELGGIFLGTLIGLGAVLIAPKLAHIFSSHHSINGYSRSIDQEGLMTSASNIISKIDEALQENHIDSMSCLERAACTYMQTTNFHSAQQLVQSNSSNSLINFVIDGSKLKAALQKGLKGDSCTLAYPQCSFSKSSIITSLKTIISSNKI